MGNRIALLVRVALVAAALPAVVSGVRSPRPRFVIPPSTTSSDPGPLFASGFLPAVPTKFVHGATLAEMPNGNLAAAWYGGTDEIYPDVSIFFSVLDRRSGQWSLPRVIANRADARRGLGFRVKSVGNPVLFFDAHGLHLFFVVIVGGGWSGSITCMKSSADGRTWSDTQRVLTSPLFSIGMLVRGMPAAYDDGTILLPVYHEFGGKWPALARVDADGHVIDELIIEDRRPIMQPWLVVTDPNRALVLMRYSSRQPYCVTLTRTDDAGAHWSDVAGTPLVHRDSGLAGSLLDDGSLLAFYNDTAWDRRDLSIARSTDGGTRWSRPHPLEHDTSTDPSVRHEYSYPYAIRTRDGRIHVVYTWERTRIRYVTFNSAWVHSDPALAVMR